MTDRPVAAFLPPPVTPPLVTVEELLAAAEPGCNIPGPSWSRCMRRARHRSVCAALGTDAEGVPIVVCWWPAGRFPTGGRANRTPE
jgi:hypothetical protein